VPPARAVAVVARLVVFRFEACTAVLTTVVAVDADAITLIATLPFQRPFTLRANRIGCAVLVE
jgi:hypothetical protein